MSSEQPPGEQLELGLESLEELQELDQSQRELLLSEKNEAQLNARHMLNLRIGSLVFFITLLGAVIGFGWNNGYSEHWMCSSTHEQWMRWTLILFIWVVLFAVSIVQRNLEHRYDSAWQYARDLEKVLDIKNGLQQRLEDTKFPIVSVRGMVTIFCTVLFAGSIALAIVNSEQMSSAKGFDIEKECSGEFKTE